MKNTKLFYSSPFVILGMLVGLSGPMKANPISDTTAEAPVTPGAVLPEPSVPSVDELTPGGEAMTDEMSNMDDSTTSETPVDTQPTEDAPDISTEEVPGEKMPTEEVPTEEDNTSSDASNTVVDVASSNEAFSTLVSAIDAAGLKDTLMADGSFTVFAPTNQAFEALPPGVLDILLKPENKALLAKVLTHHVLGEKKMASDLSTAEVTSLAESSLKVIVDDSGVGIDDAKVLQADVPASNGVIHVIDKVLIPQELRQ